MFVWRKFSVNTHLNNKQQLNNTTSMQCRECLYLVCIIVIEWPWQAGCKVKAKSTGRWKILCCNYSEFVTIRLGYIKWASYKLKDNLCLSFPQKNMIRSMFTSCITVKEIFRDWKRNSCDQNNQSKFHHEKAVHTHIKVGSWEKIAFFLIEFPQKDLYRRHNNCVEQQCSAYKEYNCQKACVSSSYCNSARVETELIYEND